MLRHLFGILSFIAMCSSCTPAHAGAQGFHIAPTNITNCISRAFAYSGNGGTNAAVRMTLNNPTVKNMFVSNGCTQPLAFTFTNASPTVVPSNSTTTNPLQIFVGPGQATVPIQAPMLFLGGGTYVWVRTDAATPSECTSGDVIVNFW